MPLQINTIFYYLSRQSCTNPGLLTAAARIPIFWRNCNNTVSEQGLITSSSRFVSRGGMITARNLPLTNFSMFDTIAEGCTTVELYSAAADSSS
jgi:hypothetical protein